MTLGFVQLFFNGFVGWYLLGLSWVWGHGGRGLEVVWLKGWLLCGAMVERVTERQKLEKREI